jgi:hypothetical protein
MVGAVEVGALARYAGRCQLSIYRQPLFLSRGSSIRAGLLPISRGQIATIGIANAEHACCVPEHAKVQEVADALLLRALEDERRQESLVASATSSVFFLVPGCSERVGQEPA